MSSLRTCLHLTGLVFALAACSGEGATPGKKTVTRIELPENSFTPVELEKTITSFVTEIGKTEPRQLQLAVVLKTLTGTGYWEPVKVGANRAFRELDVAGIIVAPSEANEEDSRVAQIQMLNEQRDAGYDGIGVAPINQTVGESIDALADAGTTVVTIDSDLTQSKRHLYVGTLNYEAGRTSAETLIGFLKKDSGTIVILGHDDEPAWPDGFKRTQGAKDVLEEQGYRVVIRTTNWNEEGAVADVTFMKDTLLSADPPAVGMLSMFSPTFRCAEALAQSGKSAAEVAIVGFDFEPETVRYMRDGLVQATHAQRQYYMGYMVPYVLYSASVLGLEKTKSLLSKHMVDGHRFNAGLDVVRAEQLDEYNNFLDSLGVGGG